MNKLLVVVLICAAALPALAGAPYALNPSANAIQAVTAEARANVRDFGAKGDNSTDDTAAIQATINYVIYSNGAPGIVYLPGVQSGGGIANAIPQTTYKCLNGLVFPAFTTKITADSGKPFQIVGDGMYNSVLSFPNDANTNFIQYLIGTANTNNYTFLSNWRFKNMGVWGPGATNAANEFSATDNDNTNIQATGLFLGFSSNVLYFNTSGWDDSVENCSFLGWKNAIQVTNLVTFAVLDSTFKFNWNSCVWLSGVDTWRIQGNIMLAKTPTNGVGAIVSTMQNSVGGGNGGRGGNVLFNEIGGFPAAIMNMGGSILSLGGNFERNGAVCINSNGGNIVAISPKVIANTVQQPGIFVWGDHQGSASSGVFFMTVGAITNGLAANSQNTNTFAIWDGSAIYQPPIFASTAPLIGFPATAEIYGQFNGTRTVAFSSPNPSTQSYWSGDFIHVGSGFGTNNSGLMKLGGNNNYNATLSANTSKSFFIAVPSFGASSYDTALLYGNMNAAGVNILGIGWADRNPAGMFDYIRFGYNSGIGMEYHGGNLAINSVSGSGGTLTAQSYVVPFSGAGYFGLVPSGAETNAAGSRVAYMTDVSGGAQTPWTSTINGAGFSLTNAGSIGGTNIISGNTSIITNNSSAGSFTATGPGPLAFSFSNSAACVFLYTNGSGVYSNVQTGVKISWDTNMNFYVGGLMTNALAYTNLVSVGAPNFWGALNGNATTATTSTFVTGNNAALTNGVAAQFGGASLAGLSAGVTNASGFPTLFSASAAANNGGALTNLLYQYTTNAITALAIGWGKAYETNIAANFTITLSGPASAFYESTIIMVTNSSASDFKITMPAGVWGTPGSGTPPVYYCTNKMLTKIVLEHYGQQMTNSSKVDYAP